MFSAIIFDFDGTLIDSRAAILDAFGEALAARDIVPRIPLPEVRIGPPLAETLRELVGSSDETLIDALAEEFKRFYDNGGYRATEVYDGVPELLAALTAAGRRCFVATNKRMAPTRLILAHLRWENHFEDVYALDRVSPRLPNKAAMLGRLLEEHQLAAASVVYVGDTPEDEQAARANAMNFAAATWGYGEFAENRQPRFANAQELLAYLTR